MHERVVLLPGVDRDPQQGRRSVDVASWRSAFYALIVSAIAAGQAAGQEQSSSVIPGKPTTKVSAETTAPNARVRALVRTLDADTFDEREEATKEILDDLWKEYDTDGGDAHALFKLLSTNDDGKPLQLSLEQVYRLKYVKRSMDDWRLLPAALGRQESMRGDAALHLLRQRAGVPITIDDETASPLSAEVIDLTGERNTRLTNDVLVRLCNTCKVKPVPLPNGGIRLVHADDGETVFASEDLIGVLSKDADGKPLKMTIQMGPGDGILIAFFDRQGSFGPGVTQDAYRIGLEDEKDRIRSEPCLPMEIASDGRPVWKGYGQQTMIHRTMDMFHETLAYGVVAIDPGEISLKFDDAKHSLGCQDIQANSVEQVPGDEWKITVRSCVFGNIPWPPTPYPWDVTTYSLAHANRYTAPDEAGVIMEGVVTETSFNMREMTATVVFPRKPESLTVRAYREIDWRALALPGVTQPARRGK